MNAKSNSLNKVTSLNPNAEEFIPSAIKDTHGSAKNAVSLKLDAPGSTEKSGLDHSESISLKTSDDEAHRYWQSQLPDDITPDFKVMTPEEMQGPDHHSLADLSLHDVTEPSRLSSSMTNQILVIKQDRFISDDDNLNFNGNMGYNISAQAEEQSSRAFQNSAVNSWGKALVDDKKHSSIGREEYPFNIDHSLGTSNDISGDSSIIQNAAINPLEFLSSQFPGFSLQSLADVYYGSGYDLNTTIETLIQLELQVDGGFSQNCHSNPVGDVQNGLSNYCDGIQCVSSGHRYPSSSLRGDIDVTSAVKKLASKDSSLWRFERDNVAVGTGVGSSRSSRVLASFRNSHGKVIDGDKLQNSGGAHLSAPFWFQTREAVGSKHPESREARDYARLWNACFEQAKQAYQIGNKALARELILKGQWYSMQMKEHEKAREMIYRPRNPLSAELHEMNRGQEPLLNLHGLHVNEAIHVLNHKLSVMKKKARSTGQLQQVMVFVGASHPAKGTRSPARLPIAVEQYLLEEGLHYTQPRPDMFHVVIC